MKIASKNSLPKDALTVMGAAFLLVLGAGLVVPVSAHAIESAQASVSPASATGINVSSSSGSATKSAEDNSIEKSVVKTEEKVIESGKDAIKKLDTATDETTLSELNRARQVVTRIEAMIDVEKRLNELDRIRNDRRGIGLHGGAVPASFAAAIPASALVPPRGSAVGGAGEIGGEPRFVMPGAGRPKVVRIIGAGGKYSAVLKVSGDDVRTVKVGDKVSDGAYVRSISTSAVEIGGKGTSYTLHVKNSDVIQGMVR